MINYINTLKLHDKLILIYGIPFLVFITTKLALLNGIQKLSFIVISLLIILGLESIVISVNKTYPTKFKKRRFVMKDLNIKLLSYMKPIDLILLSSACSTGGILCFYLLEQTISTYLIGTLTFFISLKGMHLLILDLIKKKDLNSMKKKLKSLLENWYITVSLFMIGVFVGYKIYSTDLSNLVLCGILFSLSSKLNFLINLNKN